MKLYFVVGSIRRVESRPYIAVFFSIVVVKVLIDLDKIESDQRKVYLDSVSSMSDRSHTKIATH